MRAFCAPLRPFPNFMRIHVACPGGDWRFRWKSRGGALKGAYLRAPCLWLKQSAKASLLKVAVAGERFQEVALLHDDEADAVDCSPPYCLDWPYR